MHQHPRSPAVPSRAPPPNPPLSTPVRSDLREQDSAPGSPTADIRTNIGRGLGIDSGSDTSDLAKETAPGKEAIAKLNQIVAVWRHRIQPHDGTLLTCDGNYHQNYHTKAALIILQSRVDLPPSFTRGSQAPRVNRWVSGGDPPCLQRAPQPDGVLTYAMMESSMSNSTTPMYYENRFEHGDPAIYPIPRHRHLSSRHT